MKSNNDTNSAQPSKLLEDLRILVTEAEKLIGQVDSPPSSDAVTALRARFEASQERLTAFYGDAKKQVVASAKCTDTAIRENPYQSLAITAGIALVVGLLLGRRSST